MSFLIDTAQAVDSLTESGFTRKQADAIVKTFSNLGSELATEQHLDQLRTELLNEMGKLKNEVAKLSSETKREIAHHAEVTAEKIQKDAFISRVLDMAGQIAVLTFTVAILQHLLG